MKCFISGKLVVFKKLSAIAFVFSLAGCGGTGQDEGSVSTFNQSYSGLVIDGYLARATVFLDTNNDGTRNAWEPFAFTDNQGYFSYNPLTDTDYCADGASEQQAQYCLRTNSQYSNVVLRVDSGYDVLTGEPFAGQMSRRIYDAASQESQNTLISPLTSVLTNISDSQDQESILSSLGLEMNDIDIDYLNVDGNGEINATIFNAAIKVHKVVSVLSDRLTDTYDEIGEEVGTPNDASAIVYSNLAEQLLSSGLNYDTFVQDGNSIASVLDESENALRTVYERKEFTLPADMGSVSSREGFARVINVVPNIVSVVNSVIDPTRNDLSMDLAKGLSRAIESVVIKALNEVDDDLSIENAASFFSGADNNALVQSLIDNLRSDSSDITALSQRSFSNEEFSSVEVLENIVQLGQNVSPFRQIGSRKIRVSDLDLGRGPDKLDDSEVEWYFLGDEDDIDGEFIACVKHVDDASVDGSLGEGSTRGELVTGFWSLLGASGEQRDSYSLLITLNFLETTYQAIMKPAGVETIQQAEYQKIRFDSDGEINAWHSVEGFTELGELPQTNEDCRGRLPSRIGI